MLRYTKPAADWQSEALPLGNGRLGCMAFGGVGKERLQFNEDSLWIGDESDTGAYQAFGDLQIEFSHDHAEGYTRTLDLNDAAFRQRYVSGSVEYQRRYFASAPADVLVFEFTADRPGAYSGRVRLVDAHDARVRTEGNRLIAAGDLRGFVYGEPERRAPDAGGYRIALQYESQAAVLHEGGAVRADGQGGIAFEGCDRVVILLAAGTNYAADRRLGWTGEHPHQRLEQQLAEAARRPVDELFAEHRAEHQRLFSRVKIDLGGGENSAPTDHRVEAFEPDSDHGLEELLFQYARYLMISSSRPGCRPANLQGLWNESNSPIWRCDYHSDVNTQMNYWFVDAANLSECFQPLADWVSQIRQVRRDVTFVEVGKPGWALRAENGLFGGSSWQWSKGDASWLAQNLWDHYAFTGDEQYLRDYVYPVQRDLCEFWLADLKELPTGELVSPLGFSPEHGPHEDGVSFDQQLIWDLFTNTIDTIEVLGEDPELGELLRSKRSRLLGPQIGRWGQLQEWMVDRDDPNDDHRHFSHLVALHPGRQISPQHTPQLAQAAAVSLAARPAGATGWSKAWRINLWARLRDSRRAYQSVVSIFDTRASGDSSRGGGLDTQNGGVMANLLNTHPPFQVDGNFGYASGVCEMLLQSHLGALDLLPALPEEWSEGAVRGLCARGGFEVDLTWRNGQLSTGEVRSKAGGVCCIKAPGRVVCSVGGKQVAESNERGEVEILTAAGDTVQIAAAR